MRLFMVDNAGRGSTLSSLEEAEEGGYRLLWVDLEGGGDELDELRSRFDLHPVVFFQAGAAVPLPRLQEFEDYLYLVWHLLREKPQGLETEPLFVAMGRDFLITVHRKALEELDLLQERLLAAPERFTHPAALLYRLLEAAVDGYYPIAEALAEDIEDYMDGLISEGVGRGERGGEKDLSRILGLKHRNLDLRRVVYSHRDILLKLTRREQEIIPDEWAVYMMETYDRLVRVAEEVDYNSEQIATALDIHLNAVSNRLNRTMKRLTAVATFFMPATFLVGLYGMNFESMPEYTWRYGYLFFWVVLVVLTVAMVVVGHRQDWY